MLFRSAHPNDAPRIAEIQLHTSAVAYREIFQPREVDETRIEQRRATWLQFLREGSTHLDVAADGEGVKAFIHYGATRDPDGLPATTAEVYALYVAPDSWRVGIGRELMGRVIKWAAAAGCHGITLWVLEKNESGISFYKARGFLHDGSAKNHSEGIIELRMRRDLGLKKGTVRVIPYQKFWRSAYESEAACIRDALGALAVDVQHVGSTAVPGLTAKPIIDIAVALRTFKDLPAAVTALEELGWDSRGLVSGTGEQDHLLVKESAPLFRTHHLHINEYRNSEWNGYLKLRKILRTDAIARQNYSEIKKRGENLYADDRRKYTTSKAEFIRTQLGERKRVNRSSSPKAADPKCLLFDCIDTLVEMTIHPSLEDYARWAFEGSGCEDLWPDAQIFFEDYLEARIELPRKLPQFKEYEFRDRLLYVCRKNSANLETEKTAQVAAALYKNYWRRYAGNTRVRGDVRSALPLLKARLPLGVVSNFMNAGGVEDLLDRHGIAGYFEFVITSINTGWRKPHPRIYQAALDRAGCAPSEVLFVGDDINCDYRGPRGLGMRALLLDRLEQHPEVCERVGDFDSLLSKILD
jgi:putative hydrolase of the HAD superfamily